jgi:hypothetical protein
MPLCLKIYLFLFRVWAHIPPYIPVHLSELCSYSGRMHVSFLNNSQSQRVHGMSFELAEDSTASFRKKTENCTAES